MNVHVYVCPFKVIYIDIRLQSERQCAYQYQRECPSKVIDVRLNMNVNINVNINVNVHIMLLYIHYVCQVSSEQRAARFANFIDYPKNL